MHPEKFLRIGPDGWGCTWIRKERIAIADGVAWSVCVFVCVLITSLNPAKTAEPIEMPCVCVNSIAREAMGPGSPMGTDGRWRRGVVVSGVRRMNEVNARRARLVPGWVTVFGRVYHLGM